MKNLIPRGQGLWSIESCLAAAKEADYSVAGIIYGGECAWLFLLLSSRCCADCFLPPAGCSYSSFHVSHPFLRR